MKKLLVPLFSVAALATFQTAVAVDDAAAQQLFATKACIACHTIDKKLIGPSYQEVAAKYADVADAVTTIASSIKNGSSGTYGPVPMPPNAAVSEEEATILAEWVLSQK